MNRKVNLKVNQKKRIVPETIYDYRMPGAPALSPDGATAAFLLTRADEESDGYRSDLCVLRGGKSVPLTDAPDVRFFLFTRRGTLLAAVKGARDGARPRDGARTAGEAQPQPGARTAFVELDPNDGRRLDAFDIPARVLGLAELSDGRLVALAVDETRPCEGQPGYRVLEDVPFWSNGSFFTSGKRRRLCAFDRATGELTWLTGPDVQVMSFDCDGRRVAYDGGQLEEEYSRASGVRVLDTATGEDVCLLAQGARCKSRLLGLWGENALIAMTDGALPIPDGSGRAYEDDQYEDFYIAPASGGAPRLLARYEYTIGEGAVGSDVRGAAGRTMKAVGDRFYFTTTVGERTVLRYVDEDGRISGDLTGEGSCDSFDIAGGRLIVCGLYGGRTGELYGFDADAPGARNAGAPCGERLTRFSIADQLDCARPIAHSAAGREGHEIRGFVLPPAGYDAGAAGCDFGTAGCDPGAAGFDSGKRYPAILHIHGGPHAAFGGVYHHDMQLWASAGYFTVFCNPRGSSGRGNAYGCIAGRYGEADYDDLTDFLDSVLAAYPAIDPARVAVTGGSYGGFMTNWMIGHTDRFAAAAAQCSISNWVTVEHTSDIGRVFVRGQLRATTAENANELWARSPLAYAKNVHTPALFIHGDADCRTWMVEGLSMYTAVRANGVPARMVLFEGENHGLSRIGKPHNRVVRAKEMLAWFEKHV